METIKKNLPLVIFTVMTLFFSIWYVGYIFSIGGLGYVKSVTALGRIGKLIGFVGFFLMGLVYARSVLKMILRQDSFWKRLAPLESRENFDLKKLSTKVLILLNKSHAYLGILSVVLIFLHCYLTGSYMDNFLLQVVLVLLGVEAISGLFMKLRYTPSALKKESYLIHQQFIVAIMIIIFTLFGHLILKR